MLTVFVEYRIDPAHRSRFLASIAGTEERIAQLGGCGWRFFEGVDQPNLFVEMFEVPTEAEYQAAKAWRTSDENLLRYVAGGRERIHVWAFRPVPAPDGK